MSVTVTEIAAALGPTGRWSAAIGDVAAPAARARTGRKIVTLIPAGAVRNKTSVQWWTHGDPASDVKLHYNAGDMFVYEASLRLLDFEEMEPIELETILDERTIDRLNDEAEYCIIRGSNYVHSQMNWLNLPRLLERLKIPIIAFGIGAQAPVYGEVKVSPETVRVLKIVSERSNLVGVRGAFTAEVLSRFGVKNVEVIGCPSLMRHNHPQLDIRLSGLDEVRRVGFTVTRGLWPMYCQDIAKARALQRESILAYAQRFDLTIMSQGERPERAYWYKNEADVAAAHQTLLNDKWFIGPDDPMVELYRTRMFFGTTPAAYEALVREMDLVLGLRLHGNIMALANEVPAIYIVYDTRTRELADYLQIPAYDIMDKEPFALERFYVQERFDRFTAQYRKAYRRMAEFLDANGVAHLMRT